MLMILEFFFSQQDCQRNEIVLSSTSIGLFTAFCFCLLDDIPTSSADGKDVLHEFKAVGRYRYC